MEIDWVDWIFWDLYASSYFLMYKSGYARGEVAEMKRNLKFCNEMQEHYKKVRKELQEMKKFTL